MIGSLDRARNPALFALALLCAGLSGCNGTGGGESSSPHAGESAGEQVLRLPQTVDPTTLDPAQVQDGPTIELLMQVFEGLVQWNTKNELAPCLAEKWNISKDGKTYTFHLRQGVRFHNGRELKASDLVYSITRSLDRKTKSAVSMVYLGDIVGAREYNLGSAPAVRGLSAPDDETLKITIDAPKAYFLAKLTYPTGYAVCREAIESAGDTVKPEHMVGTGAFKMKEYSQSSARMVLEANPAYWDGAPKLARIERWIIKDSGARHDKFEGGELDLTDVSMATYRADRDNPQLAPMLRQFERPAVYYLAANQRAFPPFRDRRVRQAFAHAVDRDAVINTVLEGVPRPAQGVVPYGVPGFDPSFKGLQHDPARARKLLAEAGYPGGKGFPALTLSFRARVDDIEKTATMLAEQLHQNLGITVNLDAVEWGTFLDRRNKGIMPLYFLRWMADYLDPQNFLSTMLHSRAPENTLGYSNPEFDRLCDLGDVTQDHDRRMALYRQAEKIVVEDAPWTPIYFQKDVELWSPRLQGVESMLMGHLPHKRTFLKPPGG